MPVKEMRSSTAVIAQLDQRGAPGTKMTSDEMSERFVRSVRTPVELVAKCNLDFTSEVDMPSLVDGALSTTRMPAITAYGGRVADLGFPIHDATDEIAQSFAKQAIIFNTTTESEDCDRTMPLLDAAISMQAIDMVLDVGFLEAPEDPDARTVLAKSIEDDPSQLDASSMKLLPGGEEFVVQGGDLAAFAEVPALEEAAFAGVKERPLQSDLMEKRNTALISLLMLQPKGSYLQHLDTLKREISEALTKAVDDIRVHHAPQRMGWKAALMTLASARDGIAVGNLPTDWVVENRTRVDMGPIRTDMSALAMCMRRLMTAPQETDQSRACLDLLLVEPVRNPEDLKAIGQVAQGMDVLVHGSLEAPRLEDIRASTLSFGKGTGDTWGRHVKLYGGGFILPDGSPTSDIMPTAIAAITAQMRRDTAPLTEGVIVSGIARPAIMNDGRLFSVNELEIMGAFGVIGKPVRIIETNDRLLLGKAAQCGMNIPAALDGESDAAGVHQDRTLLHTGDPKNPMAAFQAGSAVRARNWIVRTLQRHLSAYLDSPVSEESLQEEQKRLNSEWLKSLDGRERKLINAKESKITLSYERPTFTAHVDIAFWPSVEVLRIVDRASDTLEFKEDPDTGSFSLAA